MSQTVDAAPAKVVSSGLDKLMWLLLSVFFVNSALFSLTTLEIFPKISPMINALTFSVFAFIHGVRRYGVKNILVLLALAWVISVAVEIVSVHTGFPFGLYSYVNAPPPWIMGVPIATGTVYFGMAYVSWMLANLLLRQHCRPLAGERVFTVPFVATFIMVIWDFVLDPVYSTIFRVWVWPNGGSYFGVPLTNYWGWLFTAYLIFQAFGLYIARNDQADSNVQRLGASRSFWYQLTAGYFIQGFLFVLFPFSRTDHREIYESAALAFIMSMLFVCILAVLTARDTAEPNRR